MKDALSPGLAEIADTAQRKVQEATPEVEDPSQGIAAAKKAAASFAASVMPVQPAGAATLGQQLLHSYHLFDRHQHCKLLFA